MASISATAADVRPLPGAIVVRLESDATTTAGDLVYLTSGGDVALAQANGATATEVYGIAVAGPEGKTAYSASDMMDVVVFGPVTGWSSLTIGGKVYVSYTTAGDGDQTTPPSGSYRWWVGTAQSATTILVHPATDTLGTVA